MTKEKGNKTALEFVQRQLAKKEESVIHELGVIDSSSEYQALKNTAYEVLSESIANDIEQTWINLPEIAIFTAGGTALHLKWKQKGDTTIGITFFEVETVLTESTSFFILT